MRHITRTPLLSSIICLLILSSNSCSTGKVRNGKSESLGESERRGAFVSELSIFPRDIRISDSVHSRIEIAFIENCWKYRSGSKENIGLVEEAYQLVIYFDHPINIPGNHIYDWNICDKPDGGQRRVEFHPIKGPIEGLLAYINYIPTDTLMFYFRRYGDIVNGKPELLEERELFSIHPK